MKRLFTLFLLLSTAAPALMAQFPRAYTASELYHELLKANELGSILYIAAHPDDENTRLISYFENKLLARTAYLSLTRGDGGQNLVGTEIGAAIGVLRTQELLSARAIDGGEQFFSRAVDFGYSKSSVETLDKWGKDEVLADMVWVIRSFRPDVLVTRFPPNNYAGHGHHEASAMLAEIAFEAAADPAKFPEQLEHVEPWQARRLYFNTSSWWIKDLPEKARNNENFVRVNVGEYNALLGETYARIAARSRSEHKSQGFGTDVYYGLNIEYMEYVMGEKARPDEGILDGVNTGWSRIDAEDVGAVMGRAIATFNFEAPEHTVPELIKALELLSQKAPCPMRDYKIEEIEGLLLKLAGVHMEALADDAYYTAGTALDVKLQVQHQYPKPVLLEEVSMAEQQLQPAAALSDGSLHTEEIRMQIPKDAPLSNHFWLERPFEYLFDVPDQHMRGTDQNDPAIHADVRISLEGYSMSVKVPVVHKTVDPVKAVIYRPVQILPALTFAFGEEVIVSTNGSTRSMSLYVRRHDDETAGRLELKLPKGWTAQPGIIDIPSGKKGTVERFDIALQAGSRAESGHVEIQFTPGQSSTPWEMTWQLAEISYDHIPTQIYLNPARIALKQFNLERGRVQRIGYVEGPGDEVAHYLRAVGYEVEHLSADKIQSGQLSDYDAIITGIRAYNTREDLSYLQPKLNAYVEGGGMLLVQYNTSHRLKSEALGPYPLKLGRERVTDEDAPPRFLRPEHPALLEPNALSTTDFEGWVQERGLYFAAEWEEPLEALIAWNDPGEPERKGGLVVAPYGKGYFAYTGISFFRQLPAGVPGAYRLLANLLHLQAPSTAKP